MDIAKQAKRKHPDIIAQNARDNGHVPVFLSALCELLMCSDPFPASAACQEAVMDGADKMARRLGFDGWIEAYHGLTTNVRGNGRP